MKFTEGLGSIDHLTEHTYTAAHTLALREIQLATKAFLRNCSAPASLSWNFPCIHPCTFRERFSLQRGLKKLHFYSWPQLKLCSRTYTHTHTAPCLSPTSAISFICLNSKLRAQSPLVFRKDFARLVLPFMPPTLLWENIEKRRGERRGGGG